MSKLDLRRTEDGSFDEAVAFDAFVHVEVMSIGPVKKKRGEYAHVWMRIQSNDGREVALNFYSDTAITCIAEESSE